MNAKTIKIPSESAVKRMPAKDYMCADMLRFFRDHLDGLRQDALEDIAQYRSQISQLDGSTEIVDVAMRQEQLQQSLKRIERQSNHINKIDAAIKRIMDGEYGYCEESGEPIGVLRLLARPTATLSIESKEDQELIERTEGSARDFKADDSAGEG